MNHLFSAIKAELKLWDEESVAEHAEIHVNTIRAWLSGRTQSPRLGTLTAVADVIGLELTARRHK